jgi:hypothetical protein
MRPHGTTTPHPPDRQAVYFDGRPHASLADTGQLAAIVVWPQQETLAVDAGPRVNGTVAAADDWWRRKNTESPHCAAAALRGRNVRAREGDHPALQAAIFQPVWFVIGAS